MNSMIRSISPYGSETLSVQLEEVDSVLEDVLPASDADWSNEQQFEGSHDAHSTSAADKHAFLHSQHGFEDVF